MRYGSLIFCVLLCGCDQVSGVTGGLFAPKDPAPEATGAVASTDPLAAPLAVDPLPDAPAVEVAEVEGEVDPEAGAETVPTPAPAPVGTNRATTVAALGDPGRPGAWMETPLVSAQQAGQVLFGSKGVNVTLIPSGGPATGGSSLSLEAMQALGLNLSELTEVQVVF